MNDKLKHFLACGLISTMVLILFVFIHTYWGDYEKAIAVFAGCAIAVAKEYIWDKWLKKGTFEFGDIIWGINGAFVFTFLWIIVETILGK